MSQSLEMLLKADKSKIKDIPTGQTEIKRLSKVFGEPFMVKFRAGTLDEIGEIAERAKSGTDEMKWTVYELVTDPNFQDTSLHQAYGIKRPIDIVSTILLGGEIVSVCKAIKGISGMSDDNETEIDKIKN